MQSVLLADRWTIPGGDIQDAFLAAGHALRDGISPYYLPGSPVPFFYAPPWAVLFAGLSFLPAPAVYAVIVAAEIAALRYMAGGWRRFCLLLWFPLLPFEIFGGAINLIIAASFVAAIRGQGWLATVGSLAKLSTVLAVDPRTWRRYLLPVVAALILTLPWLSLWGAWVQSLLTALTMPTIGPDIPVPFAVRLTMALGLVATRRPWAIALGAALATPAFHYVSVVLFIAPLTIAWPTASATRSVESERRQTPVAEPVLAIQA